LLVRKRALESRLSFRSYAPRVCGLVEKDCAGCFSSVIGQVRCLGGHLGPPKKAPCRIGHLTLPVAFVGRTIDDVRFVARGH
jgi:hypothetical protein